MRLLFTVGTHPDPFDRLVRAAEQLAAEGHQVVVQAGNSTVPTPHCERHALLTPEALQREIEAADEVVSHAGPATLLQVLEAGKVPLVVPRRPEHGEHVDHHQVAFVEHVRDRVHVVDHPHQLPQALLRHEAVVARLRQPAVDRSRSEAFALDAGARIEALIDRGRSPAQRLRATLARLLNPRRR